jgi:hypothetical protein
MKIITAVMLAAILALSVSAQERTNDELNRQIKQLGVEHVTVTYDASSGSSKLMAVSENFSDRDADAAGVQAMNFALGFFYPGQSLKTPPESVHFSFWVLTKKPRFADSHHLVVDIDGKQLDLGDARYAAKPNQNLEYLNFELSLADLAAIASANKVTFHIGTRTFSATESHLNTIRAVAKVLGSVGGRT